MKRKDIKGLIAEYFFINPTARLRVRQIERELGLPLPSVINYVKELEKDGILQKKQMANVVFISADMESSSFLLEKKLFNIKKLYSCGLINFLSSELSNPSIIVFGSFAKCEDVEDSDIDLYIETHSKMSPSLERFERILKRKIQIFKYPTIKKVPNLHLANNIINGVLLNGFVEVFT